MKKEAKGKHFIQKAHYEGGPQAMKKFIVEHLIYPPGALENKVEGSVHLTYDIDHTGRVTDAKVVSGLGHGCDEEAIRLTKLLRFKVPKNRGLRVIFHNKITIHFRLPKQVPQAQSTPLQINYTTTAPQKKDSPAKPSTTYTITLPVQ